jgi:hypothetical protein
MYTIDTYNMLQKSDSTQTRSEIFCGEKTDASKTVPFYSTGWANIDPVERKAQHTTARAWRVKMLGYTDPFRDEDYSNTVVFVKNSYICEDLDNDRMIVRHDVVFQNYPDYMNPLSLSQAEQLENEPSIDSAEPTEQQDYTQLTENSINDYEDSEATLFNVPEEELIGSEKTAPVEAFKIIAAPRTRSEQLNAKQASDLANDASKEQFVILKPKAKPTSPARQSFRIIKPRIIKSMRALKIIKKVTFSKDTPEFVIVKKKLTELYNNRPKHLKIAKVPKSVIRSTIEQLIGSEPLIIAMGTNNITLPINSDVPEVKPPPVIYLPEMDLYSPKSCREALQGEYAVHWYHAIKEELDNLGVRQTWRLINTILNRAVDLHPIKSKYAFRLTVKPDGTLKFRARLVACGYSQVPGMDFDETYAPTAKYKALCIIFHLCAVMAWIMSGADVANAYVEADIDKLIYMFLPKELFRDENGKPIIVELLKSLYGLKQAGELWNRLINQKFCDLGFTRLAHDKCVYIKRNIITSAVTIIVVYVDDILFTGNDQVEIQGVLDYLSDQFTKITDMAIMSKYIGVEIERDYDNNTIYLSQKLYTQQYVDTNVSETSTPKLIPMSESIDFATKGDGSIGPIRDKVGKLRYLADRCRPDLLTAVGILGSAADNPTVKHLQGVETLGRYLKGTVSATMKFGGTDKNIKLFGYCDASHLPHGDSKPRLGYCFFLNNESGTILARSFKDKSVSHSSCESEVKAIDETIRQAIWLRGFLEELGFPQLEPTVIYTDSQSAQALINSFNVNNNSAHLVMRLNYLHEVVTRGIIVLKYIDTLNQVADVLTKLLPIHSHEHFREILAQGHGGRVPTPKFKIIYKSKKMNKFKQTSDNTRIYKYVKPADDEVSQPSTTSNGIKR